MKPSVVTIEPNGHFCSDCAVRTSAVCSSLNAAELREFEHLGRRVHFSSGETVFSEEDITTSFYNVLEGVMLPDNVREKIELVIHVLVAVFGIAMAYNGWILGASVGTVKIPNLGLPEVIRYVPLIASGVLIVSFSIEHIIALLRGEEVVPSWN